MKVILTGRPRSGKTTLVKKFAEIFGNEKIGGFITEEVLKDGKRMGFELVDLKTGKRRTLARKGIEGTKKVGSYTVDVEGFERFLKELDLKDSRIVIIDEVGKMECLSRNFRELVEELATKDVFLLLTMPEKGNGFIERFKKRRSFLKFAISEENREKVLNELVQMFGRALQTATDL